MCNYNLSADRCCSVQPGFESTGASFSFFLLLLVVIDIIPNPPPPPPPPPPLSRVQALEADLGITVTFKMLEGHDHFNVDTSLADAESPLLKVCDHTLCTIMYT